MTTLADIDADDLKLWLQRLYPEILSEYVAYEARIALRLYELWAKDKEKKQE